MNLINNHVEEVIICIIYPKKSAIIFLATRFIVFYNSRIIPLEPRGLA